MFGRQIEHCQVFQNPWGRQHKKKTFETTNKFSLQDRFRAPWQSVTCFNRTAYLFWTSILHAPVHVSCYWIKAHQIWALMTKNHLVLVKCLYWESRFNKCSVSTLATKKKKSSMKSLFAFRRFPSWPISQSLHPSMVGFDSPPLWTKKRNGPSPALTAFRALRWGWRERGWYNAILRNK